MMIYSCNILSPASTPSQFFDTDAVLMNLQTAEGEENQGNPFYLIKQTQIPFNAMPVSILVMKKARWPTVCLQYPGADMFRTTICG